LRCNSTEKSPETRSVKRKDATDARTSEEPSEEIDRQASALLAAAVEVHRVLGPGFLEAVYERALCVELGLRNLAYRRQVPILVDYKGHRVGESCLDLLVADRIVVELKAVEALAPIHWVQVRSYLKATGCFLGLLINFNVPVLLRGVRRIILTR
jgi:GxxExxY protein